MITRADREAQRLLIGTPVQDTVEGEEYVYYYVSLSEKQIEKNQPVHIVLNSNSGDADLFVNI